MNVNRRREVIAETVDLFESGKTPNEVAEIVGVSPAAVRLRLHTAGVFEKHRYAAGVRVKPNGYHEYTRGEHAGRGVHCVLMEERIGRRLLEDEVVHHIDCDRGNNDINNLALVTRSGHTRMHRLMEIAEGKQRARDANGRFI